MSARFSLPNSRKNILLAFFKFAMQTVNLHVDLKNSVRSFRTEYILGSTSRIAAYIKRKYSNIC